MLSTDIGIIGFGRFGQVLHRLFFKYGKVSVYSSSYKYGDIAGVNFCSLEDLLKVSKIIFLAVPIRNIKNVAERIKTYLQVGQIVVDVCSVKEMSYQVLNETFKDIGVHIWATHPMFGPDSTKNGFKGLVWVSCDDEAIKDLIDPYISYLKERGLTIYRTTCEEHDRTVATTQGLTHLIGRYLDKLQLAPSPIDTLGYRRLLAVRDQTCNDTWELFYDLQKNNRFSSEVYRSLNKAICDVTLKLYDNHYDVEKKHIGCYGEDAPIEKIIEYFYTDMISEPQFRTKNELSVKYFTNPIEMLDDLQQGKICIAVLPLIKNGIVLSDSVKAMGQFSFAVRKHLSTNNNNDDEMLLILERFKCG